MASGAEGKEDEFYVRYYIGHKGKFGHEFLEFEFSPDGRFRYSNNSQYKVGRAAPMDGRLWGRAPTPLFPRTAR